MKKKLLILCTVLLIGIVLALSACSGPPVSHQLEGRQDCTSCHGLDQVKPYPKFHEDEGFSNEDCNNCHEFNS
jgi:hypothetical protein